MKNKLTKYRPLKIFIKLTRYYLALAISFSALAGYVFCSHTVDLDALYTFFGVFMLAGAASALNNYQERHTDALMVRTQNRPLPLRQIKPHTVILLAFTLFFIGSFLLYFGTTPMATFLGVFNLLWYNAVYTPLKKKTHYAILVGSLTGAIPPMIGWTAAGGIILDLKIMFVAIFMFLWQIPHFWLILMKYGKDYERAGFPSLISGLNESRVKLIVFIWILSTSLSSMFFAFYHIISNTYLIVTLVLLNIILISYFYRSLFLKSLLFNYNFAFRSIYLYQTLILALLIIDALKKSLF